MLIESVDFIKSVAGALPRRYQVNSPGDNYPPTVTAIHTLELPNRSLCCSYEMVSDLLRWTPRPDMQFPIDAKQIGHSWCQKEVAMVLNRLMPRVVVTLLVAASVALGQQTPTLTEVRAL